MAITSDQANQLASAYQSGNTSAVQNLVNSLGVTASDVATYFPTFDVASSGITLPTPTPAPLSTPTPTYSTAADVLNGLSSGALTQATAIPALQQVASAGLPSPTVTPTITAPLSTPTPTPTPTSTIQTTLNDSNPDVNTTFAGIQTGQAKFTPQTFQSRGQTIQDNTLTMPDGSQLPVRQIDPLGNGQYDVQVNSAGGIYHMVVTMDANGNIQPITDPSKQNIYQGGESGGVVKNIASNALPIVDVVAGLTGNSAFIPAINAGLGVASGQDPATIAKNALLSQAAIMASPIVGKYLGNVAENALPDSMYGSNASTAVNDLVKGATSTLTAGEITSQGKADPLTLIESGAISAAVPLIGSQIPGYDSLPASSKALVNKVIGGAIAGQPTSEIALNAAIASGKAAVAQAIADQNSILKANDAILDTPLSSTVSNVPTTSDTTSNATASTDNLNKVNVVGSNVISDTSGNMVSIPAKAGSAVLPLVNVSGKSLPVETTEDNTVATQPTSTGTQTSLNKVDVSGKSNVDTNIDGTTLATAINTVPNYNLQPVTITAKKVDPVVTPDDTVVTPSPTPSATPSPTPSATPTPSPTPTPTPTTTTKATTTSGGSLPYTPASNITGTPVDNSIVASLLKTYLTKDKFKNVLSDLENMVQKESQPMIDPKLQTLLAQRVQGQQPVIPDYYTYGQKPASVEEMLQSPLEQTYKEGGFVSPLGYAQGGLPVVHGRHDFRHGAHVAGEGDGTSDDIPAMLADGEFVFPADVVSALGNGSTKAGTDKLYKMMHEIRAKARSAKPTDLAPDALKSPLDYLKGRKK